MLSRVHNPTKSSPEAIARATAWNRHNIERRRAICRKNYYAHRQLKPKPTPQDWFASRYIPVPESGCWIWLGKTNGNGYGEFRKDKKVIPAHRFSWSLYRGDVPASLQVLHHCDVRCCVNPDHLFVGTHIDNMADMSNKGRSTHGESHPHVVLTEQQILEIRSLRGKVRQVDLAERYGVHHAHISNIQRMKCWTRLDDSER